MIVHIFCEFGSKRIVKYPIFKSRAEAYVKPSICWSTVVILGIGKGVRTKRLFTSLKSPKNLTVLSALGIINAGDPHSEVGC